MNGACSSFRKSLTESEIKAAKDMAMWKAKKYYKYGKFTTVLANHVKWECLRLLAEKTKDTLCYEEIGVYTPIDINEYIEHLPKLQQEIITEHIVNNESFAKIGKKYNKSDEWARKLYKKSLEKIKESLKI